MGSPAARLVFGQSLSPDDIRRIQRATFLGGCGMHLHHKAEHCSTCRGRFICGTREDYPRQAQKNREAALKAVAEACRAGDHCPNRLKYNECEHAADSALRQVDDEDEDE